MTLMGLAKQAEKFAADNSPLILTAIGVTGTISTAVLAHRAGIKAERLAQDHLLYKEHGYTISTQERLELTWKLYLPPIVTGVLTVSSIIAANQIGTRRAAAMAAAYAISEKAFTEYKEKVAEKIGQTKEQNVRDEVAQDRINQNPVSSSQIVIAGGNVLCFEAYTGRYFNSDMESLKKAQNDLNYIINNQNYASLSDFYDLIGLDRTKLSDEVGWNLDELLELQFTTCLAENGLPAISLDFKVVPIRNYYRVH